MTRHFSLYGPRRAGQGGSARAAFTLVELLVVITVIGILMSMTMPAVQYARELGRQTVCRNNLSQIGKALMMYHNDNNCYPYGYYYYAVKEQNTTVTYDSQGNMMFLLLPFLDNVAMYDALRKGQTSNGKDNRMVIAGASSTYGKTRISTLICASDAARGTTSAGYAASNYVGSCGPKYFSSISCEPAKTAYSSVTDLKNMSNCGNDKTRGNYPLCPKIHSRTTQGSGPFIRHYIGKDANSPAANQRATRDTDVRDGASQTIFVGESLVNCCAYVNEGWLAPENGCGLITTAFPMNQYSCDTSTSSGCQSYGASNHNALAFKSSHPSGCMFLMGDGSVHFIPETIDHTVYQYLGSMADGMPVSVP